ncbi:MAG: hypothetical protein LBS56_06030 [Propionibacteriaceae bacterium]|nr:hypothetical protein [Propionibacteriaceae bacterium]
MNSETVPAVLLSGDYELIQLVHAAAATGGAPVDLAATPADIRSRWRDARAVLIGADQAEVVARLKLPPRDDVFLLGQQAQLPDLVGWSMPLRAAVVTLPAGSRHLGEVLAAPGQADHAQVVAIAGGLGGIGTTTFAAGLALAARRRGPAALVEIDPAGGGIDLVLGAESTAGWRWDTLRAASGQVADLTGRLPTVDGVAIVAASRSDRRTPPAEAVGSVVDGLARQGGVVVVDLGHASGPAVEEAVRSAARVVVLTGQSVRGVAATAARLTELAGRRSDLVVRRERAGAIAPAAVAEALGMTLLGTVPNEPALAVLADRGLPPGPVGARRFAKACRALSDQLAGVEKRRWFSRERREP